MGQSLEKLVMISMPDSPVAESFRTLRTNLLRTLEQGAKHLLFVSAWPGDGKSVVCANMAVAFAQIQKRVVVLDVDFRRPTLGNLFGVTGGPGLSRALLEQVPVESLLQSTGIPGLQFMAGGEIAANPADLLSGARMRTVLQEIGTVADCVLLDSPPLSLFAEGTLLASMVDGVVIVINPDRWRGEPELEIKRSLEEAGATVLGLVLNGVESDGDRSYGYGNGYGYGAYGYGKRKQLSGSRGNGST